LAEARRASRDRLRRVSTLLAGLEAGRGAGPAPDGLEHPRTADPGLATPKMLCYTGVSEKIYAAVIEHDEIRLSYPHPAGLGGRAPHDSRPQRSRRREKAAAD